ncbi:phosphoglycerate kinase [Patescibacteria group bacterium]|nr:phosphoglycerate kinase [Patescibacteria group bacterium]
MRSLSDIQNLNGVRVLVRAALNVPVAGGKVVNTFRLRGALPTINYLREKGAKVILMSHISHKETPSLAPMWEAMKEFIPNVQFVADIVGDEARNAVAALAPGDVLILENLRQDAREEGNDEEFARELASLGEIFVQDTFDVCHREHASIVGIPKFLPSYAGLLVEKEVAELSRALAPVAPSLAVVGGAKFSTKEPVLKKLLTAYDRVFVGGALANDFLKLAGNPVGVSLVSGEHEEDIKELLKNDRLVIPVDAIVAPKGGSRAEGRVAELGDVKDDEAILDIGPKTVEMLAEIAQNSKSVLWNGPLGNYENGFTDGTEGVARAIAGSGAHSVVGGGDTIAAIEHLGIGEQFSFISTGGGAMLDFLAEGTLPGIEALNS